VVVAFRQLQKLHEDWRETGPVAKEYRDEIWNRLKMHLLLLIKIINNFSKGLKALKTKILTSKPLFAKN
jgi:hypothetical protein